VVRGIHHHGIGIILTGAAPKKFKRTFLWGGSSQQQQTGSSRGPGMRQERAGAAAFDFWATHPCQIVRSPCTGLLRRWMTQWQPRHLSGFGSKQPSISGRQPHSEFGLRNGHLCDPLRCPPRILILFVFLLVADRRWEIHPAA
jgi:hypothetical protein